MKILAVSDVIDPFIHSPNAKEFYKDVDIIISSGDLPFHYYDYMATVLNKDIYYVYGNHNLEQFYDKKNNKIETLLPQGFDADIKDVLKPNRFGGNYIDGGIIHDKKRDLIIAGLGGSMLYNAGDSQYTEKQMQRRINKLVPKLLYNKARYGRALDILITHAPPYKLGDDEDLCHTGFKCFLNFIEKYNPKYLLHGHIHLYDESANRINKHCDTTIINVYKSYVLEDDNLGVKK